MIRPEEPLPSTSTQPQIQGRPEGVQDRAEGVDDSGDNHFLHFTVTVNMIWLNV
jgi:hypothetical protein